ncbi:hypothetical protein N7474_002533 [Penicillium riverlandense]|uniref:uncharacterized protein n=1 Tax=Penicillium riverlandense TaxID=1903569 RepID=UPI0025489ACA|nr:uncharacterized protein N7474_002533 [Penicillium riverlandense]KAJ5825395.1 hypothetical protein N7474_002533 [Penicillium riverlandense]
MAPRITRSAGKAVPATALNGKDVTALQASDISNTTSSKKTIATKAAGSKRPAAKRGTSQNQSKKQKSSSTSAPSAGSKRPTGKTSASTKQKKPALTSTNTDELPHNLGPATIPFSVDAGTPVSTNESNKENQAIKVDNSDELAAELQQTDSKATDTVVKTEPATRTKANPKAKRGPYGLTPGRSPFPDWAHPTVEECEEVNRLLSSIHGEATAPKTIPEPSLTVTGCGEVPSVLDALIRTLLSGATTGANSARAFNGLVQRFGILSEGVGRGSVNWDAVRQADVKDVFEAIKSGGLADIKSKNLKAILDLVHKDNQERRDQLLEEGSVGNNNGAAGSTKMQPVKVEKDKEYEIACADQNVLSLNHLHNFSSDEAMLELVKYPGIGPKTAACVILFCLQRPCFAVDTHIFRICKWLGWLPPSGPVNEVTAFSHLEVCIPDHLKYSLHKLFIQHGKSCPRCRAATGQSSVGWEDGCVIDHLVTRTGKRKGPPVKVGRKKGGKGKKKSEEMSDEEDELDDEESELSELSDVSTE